MKRTLYLKLVSLVEIQERWTVTAILNDTVAYARDYQKKYMMVRCNSKGDINWDKTVIYDFSDLVGRKVEFK